MKKRYYIILLLLILLFVISANVLAFKLENGSKGEQVKELQGLLSGVGYDISIDGFFGYETQSVVRDFQSNNGLNVDGIVGQNTLNLLTDMTKDIEYVVKEGDCLSLIAVKLDSTVKAIKHKNNLNKDRLIVGQKLFIPKTGIGGGEDKRLTGKITYQVRPGDSLSVLAKKYGSDVQIIKQANRLLNDNIYIGQELLIPNIMQRSDGPFQLARNSIIWPVIGRISSKYGYRIHPIRHERHFHGGIDIAVPIGTKVKAVAAGAVVCSGWVQGFGKTIIIKHGENVKTLYAHNSRLLVKTGSKVKLGQDIALSGSTGQSTGPHLDFRIYKNEKTVDPLKYLP